MLNLQIKVGNEKHIRYAFLLLTMVIF